MKVLQFSPLLLWALVLSGCTSKFFTKNYEIGRAMEATVGSEMIWKEWGSESKLYEGVRAGMRTELIYGGIANDIVKITYREYPLGKFTEPFARPAFQQDLQYDLKQSTIITFKDIKIGVINAAHDKITYKVLESPEPPQR